MPISLKDITLESFKEIFKQIVRDKEKSGITAIQNNPPDLFPRAKSYGTQYKNKGVQISGAGVPLTVLWLRAEPLSNLNIDN